MARCFVGLVLALFALEGRTGILECSFTEPFSTIKFDSATGRVIRASADTVKDNGKSVAKVIAKKARLERSVGEEASQTFELTDGKTIFLVLSLDGRGSDGMSDKVFPFSAEYEGQHGACETRKYPAWDFDALLDDVGARR
jgi:uncharacterized membrane protein